MERIAKKVALISRALRPLLVLALLLAAGPALATPGYITTVAGNGIAGYNNDNIQATSARLQYPHSVAVDGSGNLYIADQYNNRVRKVVLSTGVITTVAGTGTGEFSGDGGPATSAGLNNPHGVCLDGSGNLYIADVYNARIRKVVLSTGVITTVAGRGADLGNGGPATSAAWGYASGVAVDGSGNLYIADASQNRVRKVVLSTGVITTVAGTGSTNFTDYNGDNIPAIAAQLNGPAGVAVDGSGNLYITDSNHNRVRKVVLSTGVITTVAGMSGVAGWNGDNILATSATLFQPADMALDGFGNLYIAEMGNRRIRKVDASGVITTVAGTGLDPYNGDNMPATSANLHHPPGVAVDVSGNLYIADYYNHRVRKVETSFVNHSPVLSVPGAQTVDEGVALSFNVSATDPDAPPQTVTITATGLPSGATFNGTTFSWTPSFAQSGSYTVNFTATDNWSPPTSDGPKSVAITVNNVPTVPGFAVATFASGITLARGVSTDAAGNVYTIGQDNGIITKISPSGVVSVVADLPNLANGYVGPCFDRVSGNLFVARAANGAGTDVLKITSAGVVSVFASGFSVPNGVTADAAGNLYVSNYNNGQISKVTPGGVVSVFAAGLGTPDGLVIGTGGDLFVGDRGQSRIMRVPAAGGTPTVFASTAALGIPLGVTGDSQGNLYVANYSGGTLSKVSTAGVVSSFASGFTQPTGVAFDPSGNLFVSSSTGITKIAAVGSPQQSQTITFGSLANKTFGDAPFAVSATASSGLPVGFAIQSGPATISGNTVTLTGVGTVTVTASQAGTGSYLPASNMSQSFTVAKASQTITFGVLPNRAFGSAPFALSATASSGLAVSFAVTGPATISGNTVTLTGVGTVTVTASQVGNVNYLAAANVPQTFAVSQASQTITFGTLVNKTVGDAPFAVSATASSGLPVSFAVQSGPATISGNTVTLTGVGAVTVVASQAGSVSYLAAADVPQTFAVNKTSQTITFGALPNKTFGDAPFEVSATASSGLPVSFAIQSGPATISGNLVTLTGAGAVTVAASQVGDGNYLAMNASQVFTVAKASQTVTFGSLADKTFGDAPFAVSATASSGLPVSFAVQSGPATISGNLVTITGGGTVTVVASQVGNVNYLAATDVPQTFAVSQASQTITFGSLADKTFGDAPFAVSATAS
ncbi:MAG: hypothetical protein IT369_21200, partial [Candidatus Latescibacteria bacterium]|nr:hypothetical protein [Candidatus Latescibacterota bacterium]